MIRIVVAFDEARGIGLDGRLPWNIPDDLRHFRCTTFGHTLIMGRRTWEGIGALPGRRSIVLSRTLPFLRDAEVARSLQHAIHKAEGHAFVIGGAEVFEAALPFADGIVASLVRGVHRADSFFPTLDPKEWSGQMVREYKDFDVWEYRRVKDDD